MASFLGQAGFTSMSKVAPTDPTVELSLGSCWIFVIDENLFSCTYMAFIVTVICANYSMTSELELVRNALACDINYSS